MDKKETQEIEKIIDRSIYHVGCTILFLCLIPTILFNFIIWIFNKKSFDKTFFFKIYLDCFSILDKKYGKSIS